MNKIVHPHYPVEKLPADLQMIAGASRTVRVTIEADSEDQPSLLLEAMDAQDRPQRSKEDIDALINTIRSD